MTALVELKDFRIVHSSLKYGNGHYSRSRKLYDLFTRLGFSGYMVCSDNLEPPNASVNFIDVAPDAYGYILGKVGFDSVTISNFPGFTGLSKVHVKPSFSKDSISQKGEVIVRDGIGWQVPNFDDLDFKYEKDQDAIEFHKKRVLVYLGAADQDGAVSVKLKEYFILEGFDVDVVKFGNVLSPKKYFNLMSEADFAIINGGQSRLDVAQTQTPYAFLSLHQGQRKISKKAAEVFGFGLDLGLIADLTVKKCYDANLVQCLSETQVPKKSIIFEWKKNYTGLLDEFLK